MRDEKELRARAREAMKTAQLPERRPERMWGGPGGGALCAVCGKTVGSEDMEFELQFSSVENPGASNYHVHVRCFAAWELERRNEESSGHRLPRADDDGIMPDRERIATSQGESG
ncbi:MAG: hypothetical protein ACYDAE_09030 [Steroidobacteraceae bacterium]